MESHMQFHSTHTHTSTAAPDNLVDFTINTTVHAQSTVSSESAHNSTSTTASTTGIGTAVKRKKISRACVHCRKAHVTCEDARPCARCVKRGLADTCQDYPRKERKSISNPATASTANNASSGRQTKQQRLSSRCAGGSNGGIGQCGNTEYPAVNASQLHHVQQQQYQQLLQQEYEQQQLLYLSQLQQQQQRQHLIAPSKTSHNDTLFDYRKSYSRLLEYVKSRIITEQMQKLCVALNRIHTYISAITDNLSREDLILSEHCLNRFVVDFEKNLINSMGTPTAVWRRSGDILVSSKEFQFLIGRSSNTDHNSISAGENVSMNLFNVASVDSLVEYWEKISEYLCFSVCSDIDACKTMKFELTTVDQNKISCMCSLTVKKDIFGLPILIIGQFLPIML